MPSTLIRHLCSQLWFDVNVKLALDERGVPIAAIGAATTAVARAGLIRGRRHTSNGLSYLRQHVPGYSEMAAYIDAPAVRDRGLITAPGLADVEFAAAIMAELGVLSVEDLTLWTTLFRRSRLLTGQGESAYIRRRSHSR